ncbi:predicted protein [Postia placenta Mad-698-R]|nr:predicted protein [Postia placenta Mad-698-R]
MYETIKDVGKKHTGVEGLPAELHAFHAEGSEPWDRGDKAAKRRQGRERDVVQVQLFNRAAVDSSEIAEDGVGIQILRPPSRVLDHQAMEVYPSSTEPGRQQPQLYHAALSAELLSVCTSCQRTVKTLFAGNLRIPSFAMFMVRRGPLLCIWNTTNAIVRRLSGSRAYACCGNEDTQFALSTIFIIRHVRAYGPRASPDARFLGMRSARDGHRRLAAVAAVDVVRLPMPALCSVGWCEELYAMHGPVEYQYNTFGGFIRALRKAKRVQCHSTTAWAPRFRVEYLVYTRGQTAIERVGFRDDLTRSAMKAKPVLLRTMSEPPFYPHGSAIFLGKSMHTPREGFGEQPCLGIYHRLCITTFGLQKSVFKTAAPATCGGNMNNRNSTYNDVNVPAWAIPKPVKEDASSSLARYMGFSSWRDPQFGRFTSIMRKLIDKYLDTRCYYKYQDEDGMKRVKKEACVKLDWLRRYQDAWPIGLYTRLRLKFLRFNERNNPHVSSKNVSGQEHDCVEEEPRTGMHAPRDIPSRSQARSFKDPAQIAQEAGFAVGKKLKVTGVVATRDAVSLNTRTKTNNAVSSSIGSGSNIQGHWNT